MRIFVTGASGFIGSAVVAELTGAGHQVVGLARSDSSAHAVAATGAEVYRGSLDDPDSLREAAQNSDGAIHLARIDTTSTILRQGRSWTDGRSRCSATPSQVPIDLWSSRAGSSGCRRV